MILIFANIPSVDDNGNIIPIVEGDWVIIKKDYWVRYKGYFKEGEPLKVTYMKYGFLHLKGCKIHIPSEYCESVKKSYVIKFKYFKYNGNKKRIQITEVADSYKRGQRPCK
jgi:hypothetical protein